MDSFVSAEKERKTDREVVIITSHNFTNPCQAALRDAGLSVHFYGCYNPSTPSTFAFENKLCEGLVDQGPHDPRYMGNQMEYIKRLHEKKGVAAVVMGRTGFTHDEQIMDDIIKIRAIDPKIEVVVDCGWPYEGESRLKFEKLLEDNELPEVAVFSKHLDVARYIPSLFPPVITR